MTDSRRFKPYIWVSWITGLLAGSDVCEWRVWYKAHFRYAKRPSENEGDLNQWEIDHAHMVRTRVKKLEADGYRVSVEDQNSFKLEGSSGTTLGGKPDIVAVRNARAALVVDEKTGQQKMSDQWQVLVYLYALPKVGFLEAVDGEVEYRHGSVSIPGSLLVVPTKAKIVSTLQMAGSDMEPPRSPSAQECKFCDIAACPDRIVAETAVAQTTEF
jgi:hypothetical protein